MGDYETWLRENEIAIEEEKEKERQADEAAWNAMSLEERQEVINQQVSCFLLIDFFSNGKTHPEERLFLNGEELAKFMNQKLFIASFRMKQITITNACITQSVIDTIEKSFPKACWLMFKNCIIAGASLNNLNIRTIEFYDCKIDSIASLETNCEALGLYDCEIQFVTPVTIKAKDFLVYSTNIAPANIFLMLDLPNVEKLHLVYNRESEIRALRTGIVFQNYSQN